MSQQIESRAGPLRITGIGSEPSADIKYLEPL